MPYRVVLKDERRTWNRLNVEHRTSNVDELVKSRKIALSVIPADPGSSPGGIQSIRALTKALDSGFHRSDDFLRDRQR